MLLRLSHSRRRSSVTPASECAKGVGSAPGLRTAGVSSFGAGGANAHVILQEYAEVSSNDVRPASDGHLIVLSARDSSGLRQKIEQLRSFLVDELRAGRDNDPLQGGRIDLADVAFTLQTGREAFSERFGCVVSSFEELVVRLERTLTESILPGVPNSDRAASSADVYPERQRVRGLADG